MFPQARIITVTVGCFHRLYDHCLLDISFHGLVQLLKVLDVFFHKFVQSLMALYVFFHKFEQSLIMLDVSINS